MFSLVSETFIQSSISESKSAESHPPHPQPLSRVGARGAETAITASEQSTHSRRYNVECTLVVTRGFIDGTTDLTDPKSFAAKWT